MNYKYIIGIVSFTSWTGLGFVRGINSYKYDHKKYESKEPIIYTNSVIYGLFGVIMYANPIFLPFAICKEVYRLEVNVRNLEKEKNSSFYNDII